MGHRQGAINISTLARLFFALLYCVALLMIEETISE